MKGEYIPRSDSEHRKILRSPATTVGDSFPVEVFFAMGEAQAKRLGRGSRIAVDPSLPDGWDIYIRLGEIPEGLCEVKPGWETIVKIPRENIEKVMDFLYPEGLDEHYWEIISAIEGDYITLIGYAD